jgi:acyl transferase domain-containing protein
MSKRAADKAYAKAGIKPSDIQVIELHGKNTCR